jgi:glycogen debranching enzyme
MSLEIQVGTPHLAIHQAETVWLSDPDGQLTPGSERGLLFRDTRLISVWRLYANGARWELMNGGVLTHFSTQVFLTNPTIATENGDIPEHTLGLALGRWMDGGIHEDLDVTNYGLNRARFNLELVLRSDFADLFDIKSNRIVRRGQITTDWSALSQTLRSEHRNADFMRAVSLRVKAAAPALFANGRLSFAIDLAPGDTWHACLLSDLHDGNETLHAPDACTRDSNGSGIAQQLANWRHGTLKLQTPNEEFYRFYHQAVDDMAALRMPVDMGDGQELMPAAGLPWFAALFGRDSLIVALQAAPVTAAFALGALDVLGRWQARERDDARDAEPGKILHELRRGELAHFRLVPHTPYYGTADATLLYPIVLHTAWKWGGDPALLARHLTTAEACLRWIDEWGDRDGDGFQEYQTRSKQGYENMAWKDAGDAVLYPDGSHVKGPKALCELQGYTFDAWTRMAEIYDALGQPDRAVALRNKAQALADRFDTAFWDEEFGGYAYALDGDKRRVLTSVSNVGHCLWSGIVPPARAEHVVARLLAPDMFSGWGIRTLSSAHVAFNPYSYQNGSVWPHDNGLIALGMKRYGFAAEAARVARAVSGAAAFFTLHQVPELYAGLPREAAPFPVQVLGANVPQAWAAGSAFSFLSALLGFEPDAPRGVLRLDPTLPAWLPELTLRDLRLKGELFDLHFRRLGETTVVEVLKGDPAAIVLGSPGREAHPI